MRWAIRILQSLYKKLKKLFFSGHMQIEQNVKNWFDKTMELLETRFSNGIIANDLEDAVNSSVATIAIYVSSVFGILEGGRKLPAMALLRSLYQLTSRLTWILMSSTDSDRQDRLKRLEKTSLKDELKLLDGILYIFKSDKRGNTLEALKEYNKVRDKIAQRINELENCGVKDMPQPLLVLKEVFNGVYGQPNEGPGASETIPIRAWSGLHKAVHPDYITLKSTILNSGVRLYHGDVVEDIDRLRYECCVCTHRFLKEIYNFYGFDFHKIDDEFLKLSRIIADR